MKQIEHYRKKIDSQRGIQDLMGIEGNIRKIYYQSWNVILDSDFEFEKRVKHPPDNQINSLVSFVNSLIYTKGFDGNLSYAAEPDNQLSA